MSDDGDGWGEGANAVTTPGDRGPETGEDDGQSRRVEAGMDSTLAPWETGAGEGGLGRAIGESVGVIVLAIVAALVLALGGGLALLFAGYAATSTPVLFASLVGSQAGFVVAAIAYLSWRDEPLSNVGIGVPGLKEVVLVAVGVVASLGFLIVANVVVQTYDLQPAQNSTTAQASGDPTLLLLLVPAMLLVVGPCEELLFRGIVQRRIRERASAPVAIVLGGALFASVHFMALIGDLSAIATTIGILFLPSLVFGTLYEYGKSIVVNALAHGLYNSVLLLLAYVALRYAPEAAQESSAVLDVLASVL